MRYSEILENENCSIQNSVHRNTSIECLKELAENSSSHAARFVIFDNQIHAADADKFTHYYIWSPQTGIRGFIYCFNGTFSYKATGFFDHLPVDHPILKDFERAGIKRIN